MVHMRRTSSAILLGLVVTRSRAFQTAVPAARAASSSVRAASRRTALGVTPAGRQAPEPPRRRMSAAQLVSTSATSAAAAASGLQLLNSLTGRLEPFTPIEPGFVKWYICGPTVYDVAHLGHARNYIGFDIVRRVMMEYFGLHLFYVMNITDIDDKIIIRAQRNHLEAMIAALESAGGLGAACTAARAELEAADADLKRIARAQIALRDAALAAGVADPPAVCEPQRAFLELTAEQEKLFFEDMASLNVRPADAVTRVSDYVPEIVQYIETIVFNGYAYVSPGGSVYFDTAAYAGSGKFKYGKLDAGKVGDVAAIAEGEGSLSAAADGEKRQQSDFALWKASKDGEPSWDSPWGAGRPGWHIECSAMASDLLGDNVDINAGGSDLKFPHHENQMAQCEAHFNCCGWVKTFLHSGHLTIQGLKMSKSLKNFITVREALERYSPRQLRFLFLLHRFHEPMEFSDNTMAAAADLERRFSSFDASLGSRLREARAAAETSAPELKWGREERELHEALGQKRAAVDVALARGIDTPTALKALEQLVRATNSYMAAVPDVQRGASLLGAIDVYFDRIGRCFGLERARADADAPGAAGAAAPAQLASALVEFRDRVRAAAMRSVKSKDGSTIGAELLQECDELRDGVLPALGVRLDDRASGAAQFTLDDPARVQAEVARRADAAREAEAARAERARVAAETKAREAACAAVAPSEMFLPEHDALFGREEGYASRDDAGLPTEDAHGAPLSKSARKKLAKQQQRHAKLHDAARSA